MADSLIQERQSSNCSSVHLFLARGNTESYPGRVGAMANYVCDGLSSCDAENIQFDSTEVYCSQVADGVNSGMQQIAAYADRCPDAKLVLAGYSLGAQIVGDILGGGSGDFYSCTESTVGGLTPSSSPGSNIAAAVIFGNVRHTGNQEYNVGTGSALDGQYPRSGSQLSTLNAFSGKLQDYCLSQDPICALGNDGNSHTTYMEVYGQQAGQWVQQVIGVAGASSSSSAATSSVAAAASTSSSTESSASSTATGSTSEAGSSSGSSESGSVSSSTSATKTSTTESKTATITSMTTTVVQSPTPTSTRTRNTSAFSPFVFSDSAPATATTSTFAASTFAPVTFVSTTASATATSTGSGTAATAGSSSSSASSAASTTLATYTSKAAAFANPAPYTLSLVSLVLLKVLAF